MIPTLTTARLRLRAFREADFDTYAAICADAEVMQFIGTGGPVAAENAWRQMAIFLGAWALRGHGMWALAERTSGKLIGRVGFLDPPGWPGCELGWLLARPAWGQGYALEGARAARDYGRDALGLTELISLIRPDNVRSIALAQRLGAETSETIDFLGQPCLLYRHPSGGLAR